MYPESLTCIRLTIYIPKGQSSQVSNVMYMSHVWHDSFTLHRMSHMWNAYVTCDMTQYTVQSLECHVHESCVTWILPRSIERVIHQMTCVPWLNINPESPVPQSLESHIYQRKWVSHPVCAYRCDVKALFVHIEVTTSALAPSQHVIPQWHSALTICSNRVTNQPIVCRITDLFFLKYCNIQIISLFNILGDRVSLSPPPSPPPSPPTCPSLLINILGDRGIHSNDGTVTPPPPPLLLAPSQETPTPSLVTPPLSPLAFDVLCMAQSPGETAVMEVLCECECVCVCLSECACGRGWESAGRDYRWGVDSWLKRVGGRFHSGDLGLAEISFGERSCVV